MDMDNENNNQEEELTTATTAATTDEDMEDTDDASMNLDERVLCPDGSCIGVIGADGRCKECGVQIDVQIEETPTTLPSPVPEREAEAEMAQDPAPPLDNPIGDPDDGDLDFSSRTLCSDGACIGVVGPDGLCKECGTPYRSDEQSGEITQ